MVAIPVSPGPRVAPSSSPNAVAPVNPTAIGSAVQDLGSTGVAVAAQRIQFETHRTEALQTAKSLEYSTKIKEIDNALELQAQQTPSTPKSFEGMTERFALERQKKIDELLGGEPDEVVKSLASRNAQVYGVDLKDRLNRYQLSKEAEYGQHVITTKLDSIGNELLRTSDPKRLNELNQEINTTLNAGIQSRYINYNFVENYRDQVQKIAAKREADAAQGAALSAYLDGTAFADPNNPKDKAIVNSAFSRMIQSNDPNLQAKAVELSARTGIVPAQLVSTVSGRLTVGTTQQKVQAAQIVSQLMTKNPRLVSAFPQTIQSQAMSINRSIEAGIPADQAVEFAEKNINQNKSFDRDRREESFQMDNQQKLREKNIADLKAELSDIPYSLNSAEVPEGLIGQYEYLTKEFYMNSGQSYEDAAAHAAVIVKSQWKVSDIGKTKKLQRYSPESQYYVPGASSKWIKDQLLDELSGAPKADKIQRPNYFPNKSKDEINEEIELAVDPYSVASGRASYFVSRPVDEYGRRELILDKNNQPLRFTPDFSETPEYKRSEAAREALGISSEEFAQKLYEKRKARKELTPANARAVSLIGGGAFR